MQGLPNIGGVPSSPLHGAEPVRRAKPWSRRDGDRSRGDDDRRRFEHELEGEGDEPSPSEHEHTPRREPHPPADEDSGNQLDVVA